MTSNSNLKASAICRSASFSRVSRAFGGFMCSKGGPEVSAICVSTCDSADTNNSFLAVACDFTGLKSCWFLLFQCHVFGDASSFANCCKPVLLFFTITVWSTHKQSTANPTEFGTAMAYRVNGLPPFQVSFSITFPEGYVGKEKMDTKFHVDADDSQVQACPVVGRVVGISHQFVKCCRIGEKHPDAG